MAHSLSIYATLSLTMMCACSSPSHSDQPTDSDTTSTDTDLTTRDTDLIAGDPQLTVMTYNIMCTSLCGYGKGHDDWTTDWPTRVAWIRDVISRHQPDVMGIQELGDIDLTNPDQVTDVGDPNIYGAVYFKPPADVSSVPAMPDATVYYRLERFYLEDSGHFWLSATPDEPYSTGWADIQLPRLVTWIKLTDRVTGKLFYFATTHFDNNSPNQEHSATLSLDRFAPLAKEHPMIYVGDFNSTPETPAYKTLTQGDGAHDGFHFNDTYSLAKTTPTSISNIDPSPPFLRDDRIDHILVGGGTFQVESWVLDLYWYGDPSQPPSDHPGAVVSKITLP